MSDTEDMHRLVQEFFKITKLPHDSSTKAFLNRCQSHTIKANGRFYKYFPSGSGPTVPLVHGVHSNLGSMVAIAEAVLDQTIRSCCSARQLTEKPWVRQPIERGARADSRHI